MTTTDSVTHYSDVLLSASKLNSVQCRLLRLWGSCGSHSYSLFSVPISKNKKKVILVEPVGQRWTAAIGHYNIKILNIAHIHLLCSHLTNTKYTDHSWKKWVQVSDSCNNLRVKTHEHAVKFHTLYCSKETVQTEVLSGVLTGVNETTIRTRYTPGKQITCKKKIVLHAKNPNTGGK